MLASSRRWFTICACFCDFRRAECPIRRRRYSTLALCAPLLRAALGAARTERSERRARRYTQRWDTLGHLLALFVSPANEQERAWVGELAYVDEGYTAGSSDLFGQLLHEVRCISVVSASKKKPMEKESASFTMWMLSS